MTIWLVSDTHFGHEAIIGYCGRPFTNAAEMDEALVSRWNERVKPSDHVYHLGDVSMRRESLKQIGPRLNGHKRLLRGNHDIHKTADYLAAGFKEIMGVRVFDGLLLSHFPVHPSSLDRFVGNVHGHIHERPNIGPQYLNISVERTNYAPITLEEARAYFPPRVAQSDASAGGGRGTKAERT